MQRERKVVHSMKLFPSFKFLLLSLLMEASIISYPANAVIPAWNQKLTVNEWKLLFSFKVWVCSSVLHASVCIALPCAECWWPFICWTKILFRSFQLKLLPSTLCNLGHILSFNVNAEEAIIISLRKITGWRLTAASFESHRLSHDSEMIEETSSAKGSRVLITRWLQQILQFYWRAPPGPHCQRLFKRRTTRGDNAIVNFIWRAADHRNAHSWGKSWNNVSGRVRGSSWDDKHCVATPWSHSQTQECHRNLRSQCRDPVNLREGNRSRSVPTFSFSAGFKTLRGQNQKLQLLL